MKNNFDPIKDGLYANCADSRFAVSDPATCTHLADVANLGPAHAEAAIEAAHAAWGPWRAKTAKERSVLLRKWFDLLIANADDLARLMTAENGKPLSESRGEVVYAAINVGILATEHVPFGGVKQSGLGREGSHHGIDDYVEIKYLCIGDVLK